MGQGEFKKTITIMQMTEQFLFFSLTMPDKNLIFISGQSFILMEERIKSVGRCLIKAKLGENGRWGSVNVEEREGRASVKLEAWFAMGETTDLGRKRESIASVIENEANRRLHLYQRG